MKEITKNKARIGCWIGAVLLFTLFTHTLSFADTTIQVRITTGKITVNGQVIQNKKSLYPYLVYKDITYMPMTLNDASFMGLKSNWHNDTKTLQVDRSSARGTYQPYEASNTNPSSAAAVIPSYHIVVNQKPVDNQKQQYPLLNFRGITYFPMTWHYFVEEFGWQYEWSAKNGLVIQTASGQLPQNPSIPEEKPANNNPMQGEFQKSFANITILTGVTMVNHGELIIKEQGKPDKIIPLYLKDQKGNILLDKDGGKTRRYTAAVYHANNIFTALTETASTDQIALNGKILTIVAVRDIEAGEKTKDGLPNNVKLSINIETREYQELP